MTKKSKSDFGRGFIYNLILFAKHHDRLREDLRNYKQAKIKDEFVFRMWFNGASDHFYDLEIPKQWEKKEIGRLARSIQKRALELGHGIKIMAKQSDFDKIFKDLEKLVLLIDKELGVKTEKAEWN